MIESFVATVLACASSLALAQAPASCDGRVSEAARTGGDVAKATADLSAVVERVYELAI